MYLHLIMKKIKQKKRIKKSQYYIIQNNNMKMMQIFYILKNMNKITFNHILF